MKFIRIILALILVLVAGGCIYYETFEGRNVSVIDSFETCVQEGYPVMESYPRQCKVDKITFTEEIKRISELEALTLAKNSICTEEGTLTNDMSYNKNTKTWWIDLNIPGSKCNPACVVSDVTKFVEVNYRCTGLVLE